MLKKSWLAKLTRGMDVGDPRRQIRRADDQSVARGFTLEPLDQLALRVGTNCVQQQRIGPPSVAPQLNFERRDGGDGDWRSRPRAPRALPRLCRASSGRILLVDGEAADQQERRAVDESVQHVQGEGNAGNHQQQRDRYKPAPQDQIARLRHSENVAPEDIRRAANMAGQKSASTQKG